MQKLRWPAFSCDSPYPSCLWYGVRNTPLVISLGHLPRAHLVKSIAEHLLRVLRTQSSNWLICNTSDEWELDYAQIRASSEAEARIPISSVFFPPQLNLARLLLFLYLSVPALYLVDSSRSAVLSKDAFKADRYF